MCPLSFCPTNKRHEGSFHGFFPASSEIAETTNALGGAKPKRFVHYASHESFLSFKDAPFTLAPTEDLAQKETKHPFVKNTKTKKSRNPSKAASKATPTPKAIKEVGFEPLPDYEVFSFSDIMRVPTPEPQSCQKYFETLSTLQEDIKFTHVKTDELTLHFAEEELLLDSSKMVIKRLLYIDDKNIHQVITHKFCCPLEKASVDTLIPLDDSTLVMKGRPMHSFSNRESRISFELDSFVDFALKKIVSSIECGLYDLTRLNIKCFDFVVGHLESVFKQEEKRTIFKLRVVLNEKTFDKVRIKGVIFKALHRALIAKCFKDSNFAMIHFTEMVCLPQSVTRL